MHTTALSGVSQSTPLPHAQSGDVDADGQIVDALIRRLDGDGVWIEVETLERELGEFVDEFSRGLAEVVERVRALRPRVAA